MSNLMTLSNNKMMSSKEIAYLTGKQLSHVHRDIQSMIEQLDDPKLDHKQYQLVKDVRGYASEILLDHDLTMLLITGYSVALRMKVIKRWKELEASNGLKLPATMAEALRLAADQAEQIEKQQAVIAQQAPKAEFHDRFIDASGLTSITVTAKELGIGRNEFIERCIASGVLYRDIRNALIPYEKWVTAGYCVMRAEEHNGKYRPQTLFTAKGLAWIGKRIIKTQQREVLTVDCKPESDVPSPHLAALAALGMIKSAANSVGV